MSLYSTNVKNYIYIKYAPTQKKARHSVSGFFLVARAGLEPATFGL